MLSPAWREAIEIAATVFVGLVVFTIMAAGVIDGVRQFKAGVDRNPND